MSEGHGYGLAYRLAREHLAGITDIRQQCANSGAEYRAAGPEGIITVEYLNRAYGVTLPDVEIMLIDSDEPVTLKDRILLLHYLGRSRGTPPSGKLITYKDLPEGTVYFPTFAKRAIKPLLDNFGGGPERLPDTAGVLGGVRTDYGDAAVTIRAFPKVPITLVLWRGDAEFPPEGNILFDGNIVDYLPTEDIHVLCEAIAWRLVRQLKQGGA